MVSLSGYRQNKYSQRSGSRQGFRRLIEATPVILCYLAKHLTSFANLKFIVDDRRNDQKSPCVFFKIHPTMSQSVVGNKIAEGTPAHGVRGRLARLRKSGVSQENPRFLRLES